MPRTGRALSLCLLVLLSAATAASVAITMRLNYLFVISMVTDAEKKFLLGWGTVVADLWKASGLIFVHLLWRWEQYVRAIAAALVWALCFLWAIVSLLGSVAHERMTTTGGREAIHASYADVEKELAELEVNRKRLRPARPSSEIESMIAASLSRIVTSGVRVRTVDDASKNCTRPDLMTAEFCNTIGDLRGELAAAIEAARLDLRIAELRRRAATLREHGATLSADVQGEMIARFSRGLLSVKEAALGLPLLVTAVFEAIGALCPAILFAVIERGWGAPVRVQTRVEDTPDTPPVAGEGLVVDFLDECTEPNNPTAAIDARELYAAYARWCFEKDLPALLEPDFLRDFDRERERPEMRTRVRKFGGRYYGIGLVQKNLAVIAKRRAKRVE